MSPLDLLVLLLIIAALAAVAWMLWQRRPSPALETPPACEPTGPGDDQLEAAPPSTFSPPPAHMMLTRDAARGLLAGATSWGYQLQKLDAAKAAASPFDVLVIDYSFDGSQLRALKPADVERLQRKPDGGRRLVIAYFSIGEAESYRFYWRKSWAQRKPSWLVGENPDWKENYAVRFWEAGWQALILGQPSSYLDRIVSAGFDGIYLDKCDVYEDLKRRHRKVAAERPDLAGDMATFIARIASHGRSLHPGLLVIMQNAEPLIRQPAAIAAINGIGKEELLYGVDQPGKPNKKEDVAWSSAELAHAKAAGKAILVVEYLNDAGKIANAVARIDALGFVPYIAPQDRKLDRLNDPVARTAGSGTLTS